MKQKAPSKADIFEVGPRDGLQSEEVIFSVEERVRLVELLVEAGVGNIEVGSFVKAEKIPQLQNTEQVVDILNKKFPKKSRKVVFWAFIPNIYGLEKAVSAGVDGASFFVGASDTFCKKNVNRSQKELLSELPAMLKKAKKEKLKTRVYLSNLTYCPYEGPVKAQKIYSLVKKISAMHPDEIVLSDTTGDANPKSLKKVLELVLKIVSPKKLALHLHDTRGLALTNILEGLYHGITRFDSSVGGMGGCPYAPGASGNLATDDLVNMLAGMGLNSKINLGAIAKASLFVESKLGRKLQSKVLRTLERSMTQNA